MIFTQVPLYTASHLTRSKAKISFDTVLHEVHTKHAPSTLPCNLVNSLSVPSSPQSSVSSFSPENSPADLPKVSNIHKLLNFDQAQDFCTPSSYCSFEAQLTSPDPMLASSLRKTYSNHETPRSELRPIVAKAATAIETWHTRTLANMTAVHRVHPYQPPLSHINRNSNESLSNKTHVCQFPGCQMRFKRLEHLKRHFRVHTLERPFSCQVEGCGKTFSRRDNLGQHMRTHDKTRSKCKENTS